VRRRPIHQVTSFPVSAPAVHVAALIVDLQLPGNASLKEKRATIRHILDRSRSRFRVSAAEVGYMDRPQRSLLGFAAVANEPRAVKGVLDSVERFIWSHPELVVLSCTRRWLEEESAE
jgi:uncharacterized protein